jgi:hypothetical protein
VSTVVSVVPQRRRNRQFVALQVAPKARPQALRDLYRDYGTVIRHADRDSSTETNESSSATTQTSR